MTALLDERELSADERAAIADEARPGAWIEERDAIVKLSGPPIVSARTGRPVEPIQPSPDIIGDGRALDQLMTDRLIAVELMRRFEADIPLVNQIEAAVGYQIDNDMITMRDVAAFAPRGICLAYAQRGGIASDPLVRLLAYRAWGDRDRRWRKRDTAKALGESKSTRDEAMEAWQRAYGFDGVAVYDQQWKGVQAFQATRGAREATVEVPVAAMVRRTLPDIVLDVFDELDAKLSAA